MRARSAADRLAGRSCALALPVCARALACTSALLQNRLTSLSAQSTHALPRTPRALPTARTTL